MEQTFGFIFIIIGGVVTLVALFTVLSLLIPGTADRIRTVMLEHPVRSFLVGLVNFFFSAAVAGLFLVGLVNFFFSAALPDCWLNWSETPGDWRACSQSLLS